MPRMCLGSWWVSLPVKLLATLIALLPTDIKRNIMLYTAPARFEVYFKEEKSFGW